MKKRLIIFVISLLFIANFISADNFADAYVTGDNVSTSLEIASVWNANENPLFVLSSSFNNIGYANSSDTTGGTTGGAALFETQSYDLSVIEQSENFNLYVSSNFSIPNIFISSRNYRLNIFFSDKFVPTDKTIPSDITPPKVKLSLDASLNTDEFRYWGYNYRYIQEVEKDSPVTMSYGNESYDALKYGYLIRLPRGKNSLDLINFVFRWNVYNKDVARYWDMEAYVRVEILSNS